MPRRARCRSFYFVEGARTYRAWLPLRVAVVAAALLWAAALVVLALVPGTKPGLVVGAAALVALFAAFSFFYGRTSITVTREGMIAEGPFRRRPVRFEDVQQVVVRDGLGGRVYAVLTRRGAVYFTSLFSRHRELFELILERTHLHPRHA